MTTPFLIITCEHGGNEVPPPYAHLFQGHEAVLASHRGWDPGALSVAEELAAQLVAPLLATTVSRLLIDSNRSPGHRQLFSPFSRSLPRAAKEAIAQRYYHPHRDRVLQAVTTAVAAGRTVLHLAIHSFTPVLANETRRADLGLLYDSQRQREQAFCRAWLAPLRTAWPQWQIRRNYPYRGRADGLATWLRGHFAPSRYLGLEIEINQKRLTSRSECQSIAGHLAHTLRPCLTAAALYDTTSPGDEVVAICDAENRVIGQASRREMRRRNLIHRASYILVFNSQGHIFVQKRTASKDLYPGYYDIAAGGVVLAGESYEESARRELQEELGVTAELECLGDTFFADERNQVWGRVFRCRHDGPFVLQETEVESGEFMDPAAILTANGANFTPDGLIILAKISNRPWTDG